MTRNVEWCDHLGLPKILFFSPIFDQKVGPPFVTFQVWLHQLQGLFSGKFSNDSFIVASFQDLFFIPFVLLFSCYLNLDPAYLSRSVFYRALELKIFLQSKVLYLCCFGRPVFHASLLKVFSTNQKSKASGSHIRDICSKKFFLPNISQFGH